MYDLGDVVDDIGFEVRNSAGTLTTPASSTCTITLPDGTTAAHTLVVVSTGLLRLDYTTTQAGRHEYAVNTTTPTSAHTGSFDVDAKASGIVSLADVKTHLNITTTTQDEELRRFIDAATDFVESHIGPVVRRTITGEIHWPLSGEVFLDHPPVISVSSITSAYGYTATYTVTDYTADESGQIVRHSGVSTFSYPVAVTYVAGRAVVPSLIRQAALDYVKWLWESQRGATPLPTPGGEFEVATSATVPFKILQALEPYATVAVA